MSKEPTPRNIGTFDNRRLEDADLFYEKMVSEKDWDETANNFETQRRLKIIFGELLNGYDLKDKSLLDAGSGGGHFSAKACCLGANVTSLDVGESLLAQVRAKCNSTTILGDLMALPLDDNTFEFVISTEVIEHTPNPKLALVELARVLQPGGTLVVTTPCKTWQPVVRAASLLRLRPFQGRENFLWPRTARNILCKHNIRMSHCFGFNLLPIFHPWFSSCFDVTDYLGPAIPELFVNFALMGDKQVD